MTDDNGGTRLTSHVLVPVAHEEDARRTARALAPYDAERVTVMHVVEKGGGVPDKTPVEQSEQIAAEAFDAFRETHPDADEHVAYGRDVAETIHRAADEVGASAIAFRSRDTGRIAKLLTGDLALKLVVRNERPVIGLPSVEAEE